MEGDEADALVVDQRVVTGLHVRVFAAGILPAQRHRAPPRGIGLAGAGRAVEDEVGGCGCFGHARILAGIDRLVLQPAREVRVVILRRAVEDEGGKRACIRHVGAKPPDGIVVGVEIPGARRHRLVPGDAHRHAVVRLLGDRARRTDAQRRNPLAARVERQIMLLPEKVAHDDAVAGLHFAHQLVRPAAAILNQMPFAALAEMVDPVLRAVARGDDPDRGFVRLLLGIAIVGGRIHYRPGKTLHVHQVTRVPLPLALHHRLDPVDEVEPAFHLLAGQHAAGKDWVAGQQPSECLCLRDFERQRLGRTRGAGDRQRDTEDLAHCQHRGAARTQRLERRRRGHDRIDDRPAVAREPADRGVEIGRLSGMGAREMVVGLPADERALVRHQRTINAPPRGLGVVVGTGNDLNLRDHAVLAHAFVALILVVGFVKAHEIREAVEE